MLFTNLPYPDMIMLEMQSGTNPYICLLYIRFCVKNCLLFTELL